MRVNEEYRELREELRKQHARNVNEVYGRGSQGNLSYSSMNEPENPSGFQVGFKLKVLCLFAGIMIFSLYIYGGQNVKKGADMAWKELTQTVSQLEEEEPLVKETISYCKKGYQWVRDTVDKMQITNSDEELE